MKAIADKFSWASARWLVTLGAALILIIAVACGDDDDDDDGPAETTPTGAETAPAELDRVRVVTASGSPNTYYGLPIADYMGYFAEEGLEVEMEGSDGSSDAMRLLIAGNFDMAVATVGSVVEALQAGNSGVRPVFNLFYGSSTEVLVPADSDIQSIEDLEGKTIGVSDLAGGEVPVLRGILRTAGLSEEDVNIVPLGTATAVTVRSLEDGTVDAFSSTSTNVTALEVQDIELRKLEKPPELAALPSEGIVVMEDYLENNRDILTRFLRALAKGVEFGRVNPDSGVRIVELVEPERFTDPELGRGIFLKILALGNVPTGFTSGNQTAESWGEFFDFYGAERPDVDLSEIIVNDLVEDANDFDHDAVADDANTFSD